MEAPVLIQVDPGRRDMNEVTMERTMTVQSPLDWVDQYTREYGNDPFFVLGPNSRLSNEPITIGRSRSCHVKIDNESVSKSHAQLVCEQQSGTYFIIDDSSRNGTCINGQPLAAGVRMQIWSGAYVSFGDAVFVFIDPPTLRKLSKLVA